MDLNRKHHTRHTTPMKKSALTLLFVAASLGAATADDTVKEAMKKYFKPEGALAKKAGTKGGATADELAELLKCYEALAKAKPSKGDDASWAAKTGALIEGVKKAQKDPADVGDLKKATNCKACHDVHKGK